MKLKTCSEDFDLEYSSNIGTSAELPHDADFRNDKKVVFYSIKLDSLLPIKEVFQIIFRNSSHRMSRSQWINICGKSVIYS